MDSFQGYKLKPISHVIQQGEILIRVKDGSSTSLIGSLAIALGPHTVRTATQHSRIIAPSFWRAIETLPGSQAMTGDTVYCLHGVGSCGTHDTFKVADVKNNFVYPHVGSILLSGKNYKR